MGNPNVTWPFCWTCLCSWLAKLARGPNGFWDFSLPQDHGLGPNKKSDSDDFSIWDILVLKIETANEAGSTGVEYSQVEPWTCSSPTLNGLSSCSCESGLKQRGPVLVLGPSGSCPSWFILSVSLLGEMVRTGRWAHCFSSFSPTSARDPVSDTVQGGMDPQTSHPMFCAWEAHGDVHWFTKRSDLSWRLQARGQQVCAKWQSSFQAVTKELGWLQWKL